MRKVRNADYQAVSSGPKNNGPTVAISGTGLVRMNREFIRNYARDKKFLEFVVDDADPDFLGMLFTNTESSRVLNLSPSSHGDSLLSSAKKFLPKSFIPESGTLKFLEVACEKVELEGHAKAVEVVALSRSSAVLLPKRQMRARKNTPAEVEDEAA